MSTTEEIRPATTGDAAAVAAIYAHYVRHTVATFDLTPPEPAQWQEKMRGIEAAGLPFLAMTSGADLLGFAYAAPWKVKPAYRQTAENTIYLAPDAVGGGRGTRLLATLLDACAKADLRQLIAVIADTGNPASARLHTNAGFTDAGLLRRVGHKHNRWVDTLLMQLELPRPRDQVG